MSTPFSHFFNKINKITPQGAEYLQGLENIALMPKMLYFRGKIPENRVKTVAIVGSRHNTRYGEEVTYKLAYELAKTGVVVISGLAYGVDSIAHRAALDAGGVTIGVLGTPIDKIYPVRHTSLAREIIESGGAILSEYAPGAEVFPRTSFLERNRIISGLADAVVVTEAAERSGSLNTATHALDQGKDLFVVPGNITSLMSQGCNKLIKAGAMPLTGVEDVLDVLFPAVKKSKKQRRLIMGDTEEEAAILAKIAEGMDDGEDIIASLGIAASMFNQTITMLEIKGVVKSLGANRWMLV
ncbi:DNA-processing protein DprA [Candidatus Saccharibacteria bacterium]|nr:DNA-processing protein DprA [Candidatus Saccharibacteria bacterium]